MTILTIYREIHRSVADKPRRMREDCTNFTLDLLRIQTGVSEGFLKKTNRIISQLTLGHLARFSSHRKGLPPHFPI